MKFNKKDFNIKSLLVKLSKNKKDGEEDAESNILGRVGSFFDPDPQKEKVLSREDFNAAGDVYYASVSAFYKVAERLLWVVLAIFMAFSLATNYKEITYSNFFYLIRDFSTATESNASNYQILSYDSGDRQQFSLYRGGLVTASPSAVSIFTAGGRRTLKSNNDYYSPNVICCDKYVLVYDTARAAFSVYNSFSKIYSETVEYPITDVCMNDSGAFALATRKDKIQTVIYLYGDDIKQRGRITDSRFMFDMALNSSQSRFDALYYSSGSGIGQTSVCVYDVDSSSSAKKLSDIDIDGEFPLKCAFLNDNTLAIITDRSIRVYDKSFKEISSHSFGEAEINAFEANEHGVVAVASKGTNREIIVFDKKGKEAFSGVVAENISSVGIQENFIFLRTVSGVIRIDTDTERREYLPSDRGKMIIYGKDTAIVCGEAKAEYLVFGKK